ncbi:PHP domain-containing protein [Miniphocaeibacter halophilus]|uniref:PHP domain-containing protein n=1 Tax=Miniphocaeibacter halophilus TaxID=2931922 RepID=A0AC61MTE8_9FIRM|nr:PHP domain-containing protein [Miniphocaeibacter halophilus]QQK07905.1 PHP domain-containing protein [Miniphocaeibacter halophilus]
MEKNKYKLIGDYHTHTIYSRNGHGKGTIRENVEEAIKKGLEEIYITDHGPGHFLFGIKRKKLPEIRRTIDALNEEYNGKIKIYLGVEANVVDYNGKYDLRNEDLKYFDVVNLGYHSGVVLKNLKSYFIYHILNSLGRFNKKLEKYCIEKNTDAIIKIIEEKDITIITHPGDKVKVDIKRLAKVCKENNTLLEINNHHPHLSVDEIKEAIPSGVNFSLGSDAHKPEKVGIVDQAIKRVEKAGLDINRIKNLKEVK